MKHCVWQKLAIVWFSSSSKYLCFDKYLGYNFTGSQKIYVNVLLGAGRGCWAPPRMFFVRVCAASDPSQSVQTMDSPILPHSVTQESGHEAFWRESIWRQKYNLLPVELRLGPSLPSHKELRVLWVNWARHSDSAADICPARVESIKSLWRESFY